MITTVLAAVFCCCVGFTAHVKVWKQDSLVSPVRLAL